MNRTIEHAFRALESIPAAIPTAMRRFRCAAIALVALFCLLGAHAFAQASFVDVNLVAHADDDGFFQNPDIFNAILNNHTVVTVYLTGGNVQVDDYYYMYQREQGSLHEYSAMAAAAAYMNANGIVPGYGSGADPATMDQVFQAIIPDMVHWSIHQKAYSGVTLTQADSTTFPNLHLIFMRFPSAATIAGAPIGTSVQGTSVTPLQTLGSIYGNSGLTQASVDGATVFSKASMTKALGGILSAYHPTVIRALDYLNTGYQDGSIYDSTSIHYDHLDHYWAGWFVHDAVHTYAKSKPKVTPQLWDYRGYNMYTYPDNTTLIANFFAEIKYWVLYHYSFYDFHMQELIYTNDYSDEPSYTYTRGCVSNANCLTGFAAFQNNETGGTPGFTNNAENHQGPTQVLPLP